MPEGRREHDLAEADSVSDEEARSTQARDAARIHRELDETARLAADITRLLDETAADADVDAGIDAPGRPG